MLAVKRYPLEFLKRHNRQLRAAPIAAKIFWLAFPYL